jgi:beta-glucosidase/6-phospho-beta-glucosidase/beta-galactosidase
MYQYGFMFATGIENSYPTIEINGHKKRVDEMESCGHYERWKEDFQLVKDLGISFLRYGPPYYKTHIGPGQYDWSFADETLNRLKELNIIPIIDLCHFGVPDWVESFQNPDWPRYFAEYAEAFTWRYPWIRWYTPVNEIFIAATFSAQYGWWNERLHSDRAFVTALKHLCQANTLSMRTILNFNPSAIFVQSESSEYYHPQSPACLARAKFLNSKRFLALDLTYGHSVDSAIYEYLLDNGMTRDEFHWFSENQVKAFCIMGTDYYPTNEHLVLEDGSHVPSGEIYGYYVITSQYYKRYKLPVMHTETNVLNSEYAAFWLRKEWANMLRLREDGIPIIGFTWYSLTDQKDWDTCLREDNGRINACGLYDIDRKLRPVGDDYKKLITNWRDILPTGSTGLHLGG